MDRELFRRAAAARLRASPSMGQPLSLASSLTIHSCPSSSSGQPDWNRDDLHVELITDLDEDEYLSLARMRADANPLHHRYERHAARPRLPNSHLPGRIATPVIIQRPSNQLSHRRRLRRMTRWRRIYTWRSLYSPRPVLIIFHPSLSRLSMSALVLAVMAQATLCERQALRMV